MRADPAASRRAAAARALALAGECEPRRNRRGCLDAPQGCGLVCDQARKDLSQQIAQRDDHVGTSSNLTALQQALLCKVWRKPQKVSVEPPMPPSEDPDEACRCGRGTLHLGLLLGLQV
jgi:hypothetical protein